MRKQEDHSRDELLTLYRFVVAAWARERDVDVWMTMKVQCRQKSITPYHLSTFDPELQMQCALR